MRHLLQRYYLTKYFSKNKKTLNQTTTRKSKHFVNLLTMKTKQQLLSLAFLFVSLILQAQPATDAKKTRNNFEEKIENRFEKQTNLFPQEKLYLHFDKPYYSAGERMWFKGYLTDASSHSLQSMSRFIYVELINKSDSVLQRIKIKRDSVGFSGHIDLSTEMQPDQYLIRAYSYWMQNAGSDFFFRKNIFIGNTIAEGISSDISYEAIDSTKFKTEIIFKNKYQKPIIGESVAVLIPTNRKRVKKEIRTTDANGKITLTIPTDSLNKNNRHLELWLQTDDEYKRKVTLPARINDFDVQFFPESGPLVNNVSQIIAFKAIGTDGLSTEISGKVYNSKGEEVSDIATTYKGMGKFLLSPAANDGYYAVVKNSQGFEKRFNLPTGETGKVALQIIQTKSQLIYKVCNANLSQPQTPLHYLIIHCRGNLIATIPIDSTRQIGKIGEKDLPAGIITFAIVDSTNNKLCERLIFVAPTALPRITLDSSSVAFEKRGPANLCLSIKDNSGKPARGSFSIAVTDQNTIQRDTLSDHILSYLLLSSDLKGYIEDPAAYFNNTGEMRNKTDLLMLTQGWRRFDTENVIKGQFKKPSYYLEIGQAVSGKVVNMLGKPQKKGMVYMMSAKMGTLNYTTTDSLGRFMITDVSFPDSTLFVLKAMRGKMFNNTIELIADKDSFPTVREFYPDRIQFNKITTDNYMQQAKEKFYMEGGIRMYNLNEVSVVAKKADNKPQKSTYANMGDTNYNRQKLSTYNASNSILFVLSTMPGVRVSGNSITLLGNSGPPLIMLDGVPIEGTDELSMMNIEDIEDITLFKGASAAFFGSQGGNGVIAIAMREGVVRNIEKPNLAKITPLGYQKPAQFYMPKYSVDSIRLLKKADLRNTIYWNPALQTDSNGIALVKFYQTDKPTPLEVIIEGVTENGEICRFTAIIRRKESQ